MEKVSFDLNGRRYTMTIQEEHDNALIGRNEIAELLLNRFRCQTDRDMDHRYDRNEVIDWIISLKLPTRVF